MTKYLHVLLICISPMFSVFAQTGRPVAVTAEQEVEIKNNDVAAARTAALAIAARDAVEKGFGTYVQVEQLEGMRQVLAQTAAGLKYRILAEQKRGERYWVKIQANVYVPEEYADVPREEREVLGESMKNFVQKYPQGEINWGDGLILAYGRGEMADTGAADAEGLAGRAAELDAKAHLLEIINDIPVDDRTRLGQEKQMAFGLEGFVRDAEVVAKSKSGTTVNVTVQAPIRGVKGLAMTVYGYYTPQAPPPEEKAAPQSAPVAKEEKQKPPPVAQEEKPQPLPEPEKFTGLVIDAREVSANPAIFPKVRDTRAREVHSVNTVNREDLQKRGMASYAVIARDVPISRLFPRALILPASFRPEDVFSQAAQSKRRQGDRPLIVIASAAQGPLQADLIVSEEDAGKIKLVAEKTGALKESRVVIVLTADTGAVEVEL